MRRTFAKPRLLACAAGALAWAVGAGALRAQAPAAMAAAAPAPWSLTAQLSQGYDSNVFLNPGSGVGDATTQLMMRLGGAWSGPRWNFAASYVPEEFTFARHSQLDYLAQSYRQSWLYDWGPHTRLTWTAGADRYPERGGMPEAGSGVAAVAEASQALALESVLTDANSMLGWSHQYSPRSTWNASLLLGIQSYRPDEPVLGIESLFGPVAMPRSQTRSGSGTLDWSHQLTEHRLLRLSGTDSELWFSGRGQRVRYDNVQASLQQQLGPRLTLRAGGGPAWSRELDGADNAAYGHLPDLGYAAHASLDAAWGRNQYGLTWQHAEQMGFAPGGVTTDVEALRYGRRWGQDWGASASFGRSRFMSLVTSNGAGSNRDSFYFGGGVSDRIADAWSLDFQASYNRFALPQLPEGSDPVRRTQFSLGIRYQLGGAREAR